MKSLSPVHGLQAGCVAIMLSSVVITLLSVDQPIAASVEPSPSTFAQDEIAAPPDERAMEKFMARKLASAQKTLEAIAKDDFKTVVKLSDEMIDLSRHEAWKRMASARFVQDTADFVSSAEFLRRMADARDADGVSLGYAKLTLSCANCHVHIRKSSVADLRPAGRPDSTLLVDHR